MINDITPYIDHLVGSTKDRIGEYISSGSAPKIIPRDITYHLRSSTSIRFTEFYHRTAGNKNTLINAGAFFREFKQKYALQGIDNSYLDRLANNKKNILNLIEGRRLHELYFDYFANAKIKHKRKFVERDLGSFFTKLVHTFLPNEYAALDNPVRKYFGLAKESFYVAFIVVSRAYVEWASENKQLLWTIRRKVRELDARDALHIETVSDIKVLDLIFWYVANIRQ